MADNFIGVDCMCKVIIGVLTYNLEKYISACLESILSQKTEYEYKILVSDDCSTDRTREILKTYQRNYPEKIELLFSNTNGGCSVNALRIYERLDSEYFAILDGDDLWLNDNRLQMQVDFLEQHLSYTMCSGQTITFSDSGDVLSNILPQSFLNMTYNFQDFFERPMLLHISGLLHRNVVFKEGVPRVFYDAINTYEDCALRGEDFRRVLHLEKGPAYILNEVVSGYRIHARGLWSGMSAVRKSIETAISAAYYDKYYGKKYPMLSKCIKKMKLDRYNDMWKCLLEEGALYPELTLCEQDLCLLLSFLQACGHEKKVRSLLL